VLSPSSLNTIKGDKVALKCKSLFNNDPIKLESAIKALEREVAYRAARGELEYMSGIDPWLNQGMFENEYDTIVNNDLFGVGRSV